MSVFFVKVPPKSDFQSITEEPKYQAKALTVVTGTIKTAGAAVVVTIPNLNHAIHWIIIYPVLERHFAKGQVDEVSQHNTTSSRKRT